MTTLILACLAVLLAGPLPALVATMPILRRTPLATMVLWQSLALAAVLAALGSSLSLATSSHPWWVTALAILLTCVVAGRLMLSGHLIGTSLRARRRHHRNQVDLLATDEAGVRFLDSDAPVAYCVPALRDSRVVVSTAARDQLTVDELDAVLAHERSHLRARHDLVLEAFSVLHQAFPRWVSSAAALREVRSLVEILADRAAARLVGARPLAQALIELAGSRPPSAALGAGGERCELLMRVELLADQNPHHAQTLTLLASSACVLALPTVLVVLPWLTELTRHW